MGESCLTFCLFSLCSAHVGWGRNVLAAPNTKFCERPGASWADCLHSPEFICESLTPRRWGQEVWPLGHEGAALVNGITAPKRRLRRAPSPLLLREDTARSLWSVIQEAGPRQTLNLPAAWLGPVSRTVRKLFISHSVYAFGDSSPNGLRHWVYAETLILLKNILYMQLCIIYIFISFYVYIFSLPLNCIPLNLRDEILLVWG